MCAPTSEDYHKLTSNSQTKTFPIFTLSQTLIIYRGNRVCGCRGRQKKKNELLTFSEQHLLYLVTTALQRAPFTRWKGRWGGRGLSPSALPAEPGLRSVVNLCCPLLVRNCQHRRCFQRRSSSSATLNKSPGNPAQLFRHLVPVATACKRPAMTANPATP